MSAQSGLRGLIDSAVGASSASGKEGGADINAGLSTLQIPKDFWTKIASGDRTTAMSALTPEIGTISSQYQGARKAASEFAGRGGGRAAGLEESRFKEGSDVQGLLSKLRTTGMDKLTGISGILQQLGLAKSAESVDLLGMATSAQTGKAQMAAQSQGQIGQGVGQILGALMLMAA